MCTLAQDTPEGKMELSLFTRYNTISLKLLCGALFLFFLYLALRLSPEGSVNV